MVARHARGVAVPVTGFSVDGDPRARSTSARGWSRSATRTTRPASCSASTSCARLLEALPERVVVLLDEALRDFADAEPLDATLALLERFPRLLIFRTFSKAWGLAGLRCGYALGGPGAEPLLEQLAPELGVNELAQAGALEAVRTVGGVIERRRATIAAHRDATDRRAARARPRRRRTRRPTCCGCRLPDRTAR